jgi:uncharacterized repeat protein (TIGR03803 family)
LKTSVKNLFLLPPLIAGVALIPAGPVAAQTFTVLHSFSASGINSSGVYYTNSDGAGPIAGLILSGNTLYGTAYSFGSSGGGTVFAVNSDGSGFAILHSFTEPDPNTGINSDGAYPVPGLISSDNVMYGTAQYGGSSGKGTVFAVNTDGTGFTNLLTLSGACCLILSDNNTFYGTTYFGGSSGNGMVFSVNADGSGVTTLHSFTADSGGSPNVINSDGANPSGGLTLSGNTLYGTARSGGRWGQGTVFAVNTDATGFKNLHSFTALSAPLSQGGTNSDGAWPVAGLILSGTPLYGTAGHGGSSSSGTVFKVNTDGTGFTPLYSFTQLPAPNTGTNGDGANPLAGLILSGNTLYGTANSGGGSGNGTVFSLSLGSVIPPQLTIISSVANVILTWPTNSTGFTLQTSLSLDSPNSWIDATGSPVIVGDQYFVTNIISGTARFYRLSK